MATVTEIKAFAIMILNACEMQILFEEKLDEIGDVHSAVSYKYYTCQLETLVNSFKVVIDAFYEDEACNALAHKIIYQIKDAKS
jgi:hypothetical protein